MLSTSHHRPAPISWSGPATLSAAFADRVQSVRALPSSSPDAVSDAETVVRDFIEDACARACSSLCAAASSLLPPAPAPRGTDDASALAASRAYRDAVGALIAEWEDGMDRFVADGSLTGAEEGAGLWPDELKIVAAVLELAEIVLLDADAGAVGAAAAVRFLRGHLVPDPRLEDVAPECGGCVEEMVGCARPEEWGRAGSGGERGGGYRSPFWLLVRALCECGRLEDAWALLSRHSLCGGDEATEDDAAGFYELKCWLTYAPLPGGRCLAHDDYDASAVDDGDGAADLYRGVPSDAWMMWDGAGGGQPAAHSHWRNWSETFRSHHGVGDRSSPLGRLLAKVPPLRWACADVLAGTPHGAEYAGWGGEMLRDLLYGDPDTRRAPLARRAERAVAAAREEGGAKTIDEKFLAILGGDAAVAVNTVHYLGGDGESPVAATVGALLCDLLTRTGAMPPVVSPGPSSPPVRVRTELFLSAAHSVESHFVGHRGPTGTSAAAALLRLDGTTRAATACHDLLCRVRPVDDDDATALVDVCRGDDRLAAAAAAVATARAHTHRHAGGVGAVGRYAHWMLRAVAAAGGASSPAGARAAGRLAAYCGMCAGILLEGLARDGPPTTAHTATLDAGRDAAAVLRHDDGVRDAPLAAAHALLSAAVDLADALRIGDAAGARGAVVACLAPRNDTDGAALPLAPAGLMPALVVIATGIIRDKSGGAFDPGEIGMIMGALTLVEYGQQPCGETFKKYGAASVAELRRDLGRGLAAAYVAENRKLAEDSADNQRSTAIVVAGDGDDGYSEEEIYLPFF